MSKPSFHPICHNPLRAKLLLRTTCYCTTVCASAASAKLGCSVVQSGAQSRRNLEFYVENFTLSSYFATLNSVPCGIKHDPFHDEHSEVMPLFRVVSASCTRKEHWWAANVCSISRVLCCTSHLLSQKPFAACREIGSGGVGNGSLILLSSACRI